MIMNLLPGYITPDKTEYRVPAPYFSQNDNSFFGSAIPEVQCCPTNNALTAFFFSPKFRADFLKSGLREPEDYYKQEFEKAGFSPGDRGDHDAHTATLKKLGIKTKWTTSATDSQIIEALKAGKMLVAGLLFRSAGHIVSITGYYGKELGTPQEVILGYLIHDCYGLRNGSSDSYGFINPRDDSGAKGAYDRYGYDVLQLVLFDGPKCGAWVRFFEGLDDA
jgi:hypothetical protein